MRDLLAWLAGRRRRYRVAGLSMYPTFAPGQAVLVDPHAYARGQLPRRGEVVLARDPRQPQRVLIKRVEQVTPQGLVLRGDHPDPAQSTDSRSYGPVPRELLLGRVVCRLPWPL